VTTTTHRYRIDDLPSGKTVVFDRTTQLAYLFDENGNHRSGPRPRFDLSHLRTQCH
jgi:hypothetical protein